MARPLIYVVAWAIGAAAGVGMPDVPGMSSPSLCSGEGHRPSRAISSLDQSPPQCRVVRESATSKHPLRSIESRNRPSNDHRRVCPFSTQLRGYYE